MLQNFEVTLLHFFIVCEYVWGCIAQCQHTQGTAARQLSACMMANWSSLPGST